MSIEHPESSSTGKQSSQKKSPSFLISLVWGFAAFIVMLGALEGFSRTKYAAELFPLRSVGSYHGQFELKWFELQDYVQENGGVDVVLLGNSMVNTGIDPAVFAERYQQLTDQNLRIFNFGIDALTVEAVSVVAELIESHYHPGTIVLFTEMRDYIAGNGVEVTAQFLDNSWMRYQLGASSLEGYMIDHSALLEYLLPYRNWSNSSFIDSFRMDLYRKGNITAQGYEPDMHAGFENSDLPDPSDPAEQLRYQQAADFSIDPDRVRNLQDIIGLQQSGTQVIVTEIPVYPTYYLYFGSASVREQYLTDIAAIVQAAGSQFIPPVDEVLIPIPGRSDDHHMNYIGAPIYSRLLAAQLAQACSQSGICLSSASQADQP